MVSVESGPERGGHVLGERLQQVQAVLRSQLVGDREHAPIRDLLFSEPFLLPRHQYQTQ